MLNEIMQKRKNSFCLFPFMLFQKHTRGAYLAQSVEYEALDLRVMSSSPTLSVEFTLKNKTKQNKTKQNKTIGALGGSVG